MCATAYVGLLCKRKLDLRSIKKELFGIQQFARSCDTFSDQQGNISFLNWRLQEWPTALDMQNNRFSVLNSIQQESKSTQRAEILQAMLREKARCNEIMKYLYSLCPIIPRFFHDLQTVFNVSTKNLYNFHPVDVYCNTEKCFLQSWSQQKFVGELEKLKDATISWKDSLFYCCWHPFSVTIAPCSADAIEIFVQLLPRYVRLCALCTIIEQM